MKKLLVLMVMTIVLMVTGIAGADSEITFRWTKNTESDLSHYMLYTAATAGGQAIDGTGVEIQPEAGLYDIGVIPNLAANKDAFTLINVADGTWYYVMTAVDTSDNESDVSNEVSTIVDSIPPGVVDALEVMGIIRVP